MKVKTKRKICGFVGLMGFVSVFFAVGGIEHCQLSTGKGFAMAAIGLAVCALFWWKGGIIK